MAEKKTDPPTTTSKRVLPRQIEVEVQDVAKRYPENPTVNHPDTAKALKPGEKVTLQHNHADAMVRTGRAVYCNPKKDHPANRED